MLVLRSFLVIVACCVTAVTPGPVKAVYDQRQTGDLNVQIELKNLQVIALLNSELLDDYTVNPFAEDSPFWSSSIFIGTHLFLFFSKIFSSFLLFLNYSTFLSLSGKICESKLNFVVIYLLICYFNLSSTAEVFLQFVTALVLHVQDEV